MGRYTTVQAYSDNNPKLVHVSYDQAKGKDAAEGEGKAGGKLVVEKTDQVMGSCAGAGSGEFHTYRAHRRREMHRVAIMDEEMREEEATTKLQSAMEQGQKECEERTRKKSEKRKRKEAEKRKRQKQAKTDGKKQAKTDGDTKGASSSSSSSGGGGGGKKGGGGASSSSEGDAAEEFVYIPEADQAASGGDGGAPAAYKNDGSFLEKMKKELELAGSGSVECGAGSSAGGDGGGSKAVAAK